MKKSAFCWPIGQELARFSDSVLEIRLSLSLTSTAITRADLPDRVF